MHSFETFPSDNETQIDLHDSRFEAHVDAVNEHLSRLGSQYFIDQANAADNHNGIQYMRLGGGDDQSQRAALMMPGTFGNGLWPHIVARAEALSFQAANAGLRDDQGNVLPVIVTGSPSMASRYALTKDELQRVSRGNFSPLAERHSAVAHMLGVEEIPGAVGTSQGSVVVEPLMESARHEFASKELKAVLIEPPHARRRNILPVPRLLKNFAQEGAGFKPHLQDEAIAVIDDLFATKNAAKDFEKGIIREWQENLAIVRGFGRGGLARDIAKLALNDVATTVIYGSESHVSNSEDIQIAINGAKKELELADNAHLSHNLRAIEITGANHSFGDRVGRFATIAAIGLTR